jgi:hypothetical protein
MLNHIALRTLTAWLLAFFQMHATPPPACADSKACTAKEIADRDDVQNLRSEVTDAILSVSYDPTEPPLFKKGYSPRGQTALLLAAIGAHESGLQPRVARGEVSGDGGKSKGIMQQQVGNFGIRLTVAGFQLCTAQEQADPGFDCLQHSDLLSDMPTTMRLALHELRQYGLNRYTGEGTTRELEGPANVIEGWARDWLKSHPVPVTDAAVAEPCDD